MKDRRRLHLAKKAREAEAKPKAATPIQVKKKTAVVIGKAYTLEEVQVLISSLSCGLSDREISAVAEFADNQGVISEAAANIPEVSGTEIMELVIAAVMKNQKKMLLKFEKERDVKALRFISRSSSVPPKIQKAAKQKLDKVRPAEPAAPKAAPAGPSLISVPYTPKEVKVLIQKFESKVEEIKVSGAVQFIKDYPRIAPTVAKMPMLTVTKVTTQAVEVIKQHTDRVIDTMVQKKMRPALIFLSSLAQVPLQIRKRAEQAAEKLKPAVIEPIVAAVAPRQPDYEARKEYTPFELRALLDGLGSVERVRVVMSAAEFLRNYDIIIKTVSKTPMLTVTEVTTKAVKAIESNLDAVLKELSRTKSKSAITFLAHSSKFSDNARKKAQKVLKRMLSPFGDDKQ